MANRLVSDNSSREIIEGICPCCNQPYTFPEVTVSLDLNTISYRGKTIKVRPRILNWLLSLQRQPVKRYHGISSQQTLWRLVGLQAALD